MTRRSSVMRKLTNIHHYECLGSVDLCFELATYYSLAYMQKYTVVAYKHAYTYWRYFLQIKVDSKLKRVWHREKDAKIQTYRYWICMARSAAVERLRISIWVAECYPTWTFTLRYLPHIIIPLYFQQSSHGRLCPHTFCVFQCARRKAVSSIHHPSKAREPA